LSFWGGPDRFFLQKAKPLPVSKELAFFAPQRLFSFLEGGIMADVKTTVAAKGEPVGKPVPDDVILKVAKEVVVKFIEVGRLSPANFNETFQDVYRSVRDAVRS